MSLAERIKAATPDPRRSALYAWLDSLDPDDRCAAEAMAANPAWSVRAIVEFLAGEGVAVGRETVTAWRVRCGLHK